ncbi:MAG: hypothetical protein ACOX2R_01425 [Anaerolineae bacterium]|jgi:hypothetical protein
MEIRVADPRVLVFQERATLDKAEGLAWGKKDSAFGTLARLFQRPSEDDYELAYREVRYEPFWHVVVRAEAIYDRLRSYAVSVPSAEVKAITINEVDYDVIGGQITLEGMEHCQSGGRVDVTVNARDGQTDKALAAYLNNPYQEVSPEAINSFAPESALVLPPTVSASTMVKRAIAGTTGTVDADTILDETLEVERMDLYFRPIYGFTFRWISKDREGTLVFDALKEEFSTKGKVFPEFVAEPMDAAALLDVSAETIHSLLPGDHLFELKNKPLQPQNE